MLINIRLKPRTPPSLNTKREGEGNRTNAKRSHLKLVVVHIYFTRTNAKRSVLALAKYPEFFGFTEAKAKYPVFG